MEKYIENFKIAPMNMDDAGVVSSAIKKKLKSLDIDPMIIRKVAIACYEAEINIVIHSHGGNATLEIDEDQISIRFVDLGPGIKCIQSALQEGFSTASKFAREQGFGAGMGLPNIKNVADEFWIDSNETGTTLHIQFKRSNES